MWLCDYKYIDENTVNYVVMNKVSIFEALNSTTVNRASDTVMPDEQQHCLLCVTHC